MRTLTSDSFSFRRLNAERRQTVCFWHVSSKGKKETRENKNKKKSSRRPLFPLLSLSLSLKLSVFPHYYLSLPNNGIFAGRRDPSFSIPATNPIHRIWSHSPVASNSDQSRLSSRRFSSFVLFFLFSMENLLLFVRIFIFAIWLIECVLCWFYKFIFDDVYIESTLPISCNCIHHFVFFSTNMNANLMWPSVWLLITNATCNWFYSHLTLKNFVDLFLSVMYLKIC